MLDSCFSQRMCQRTPLLPLYEDSCRCNCINTFCNGFEGILQKVHRYLHCMVSQYAPNLNTHSINLAKNWHISAFSNDLVHYYLNFNFQYPIPHNAQNWQCYIHIGNSSTYRRVQMLTGINTNQSFLRIRAYALGYLLEAVTIHVFRGKSKLLPCGEQIT